MRILIVDDEGSLLVTLAANLELEGFEVTCASDGEAALELVETQEYDLVLTDVRMPGMNGVELFRRIRCVDGSVPVILMTAFALETLIEEAITEGVFAVLPKPFEIEHVVGALVRASKRPAVLMVDDEAEARATATRVSKMGVPCMTSTVPEDALALVRARRADVCVVDVGSSAAREARLVREILAADGGIAVIAVASHGVGALLREVATLGVYACLRKPFQPADLVRLVASARGRRQAPRAQAPEGI